MNLYQKAKRGLLDKTLPLSQARVFTTEGRYGIHTYHVVDSDGRELALHRGDAVVVMHGLKVALAKTKVM